MTPEDETYLRRAIELAAQAGAAGEYPFAALLVEGGAILAEERHSGRGDRDITAHPELKLARWAAREFTRPRRHGTTMYCSCEPCPMCATALGYAGIGRVVFALSLEQLRELRPGRLGTEPVRDGPALFDAARVPIDRFYKA